MLEQQLVQLIAWATSVLMAGWIAAMWLSRKFESIKTFVSDKLEKFEEQFNKKLEYHERHDDQRFNHIQDDLWTIKLRNAAVDGKLNIDGKTAKD